MYRAPEKGLTQELSSVNKYYTFLLTLTPTTPSKFFGTVFRFFTVSTRFRSASKSRRGRAWPATWPAAETSRRGPKEPGLRAPEAPARLSSAEVRFALCAPKSSICPAATKTALKVINYITLLRLWLRKSFKLSCPLNLNREKISFQDFKLGV